MLMPRANSLIVSIVSLKFVVFKTLVLLSHYVFVWIIISHVFVWVVIPDNAIEHFQIIILDWKTHCEQNRAGFLSFENCLHPVWIVKMLIRHPTIIYFFIHSRMVLYSWRSSIESNVCCQTDMNVMSVLHSAFLSCIVWLLIYLWRNLPFFVTMNFAFGWHL